MWNASDNGKANGNEAIITLARRKTARFHLFALFRFSKQPECWDNEIDRRLWKANRLPAGRYLNYLYTEKFFVIRT